MLISFLSQVYIIANLLFLIDQVNCQNQQCQPCFYSQKNVQCKDIDEQKSQPFVLHMAVHPHLDAFWIYDFDTYYDVKTQQKQQDIRSYLQSNHMSSVKQIFDSALEVLAKSRILRIQVGYQNQLGRRTFFNSQIGFFKHWFMHLNIQKKKLVQSLLATQYWQILGGGFVQHDEGCSYYQDIIENYEIGLHFLKQNLNYIPKIAISSDSFGHSQSTAAILSQIGMQGFLVQRSDEHLITSNKTQFIWNAVSSNNITYGSIPTHIRWQIHGFQDQFGYYTESQSPICQLSQQYIEKMRKQNKFLKQIIKSNHVMRYFGHDFQKFTERQYGIIQTFMEQFVRQKCENVIAMYSNPTQYFKILMGQVMGKQKPVQYRKQDLFPNWLLVRARQSQIIKILKIKSEETSREYEHINRFGEKSMRISSINSGKYALGTNVNRIQELNTIKKVFIVKTQKILKIIVIWHREGFKTIIQSNPIIQNSWKVQTISAAQPKNLQQYYIQFSSKISNRNKFFTDSNGWLTTERKLFQHEDYKAFFPKDGMDNINGNTYPITAFAYIEDDKLRLAVNTDRPQGVTCINQGTILVNFDRITSDDGKWVYEQAYRSQYQKFKHYVTLQKIPTPNNQNSHRLIQKLYDQPILIQINLLQPTQRLQPYVRDLKAHNQLSSNVGLSDTKFWIRSWNDSYTTLRIQNIYDHKQTTVSLFKGKISLYLTAFYGNVMQFQDMQEMSLGGNMKYKQFIQNKWNWKIENTESYNQIFHRIFAQKITLKPLQIRTFRLKNIKSRGCLNSQSQLKFDQVNSNPLFQYQIKDNKIPILNQQSQQIQKTLRNFLYQSDHRRDEVPILYKQKFKNLNIDYSQLQYKLRLPDFVPKLVQFTDQLQKDIVLELDIHQQGDKVYENVQNMENQQGNDQLQMEQSINESIDGSTVQQLRDKIELGQQLTTEQKRVYFKYKYKQIRKRKLKRITFL